MRRPLFLLSLSPFVALFSFLFFIFFPLFVLPPFFSFLFFFLRKPIHIQSQRSFLPSLPPVGLSSLPSFFPSFVAPPLLRLYSPRPSLPPSISSFLRSTLPLFSPRYLLTYIYLMHVFLLFLFLLSSLFFPLFPFLPPYLSLFTSLSPHPTPVFYLHFLLSLRSSPLSSISMGISITKQKYA